MGELSFADKFNLKCVELHKEYSELHNLKVEDYDIPDLLMHSVAEISEAYTAFKRSTMDKHLPTRKGIEVELADCFLILMDIAGGLNLDVGSAIEEKHKYNKTRTR